MFISGCLALNPSRAGINKEFHLFTSPWSSSIAVKVTCLFSGVIVTAKLKGIASILSTKAMVVTGAEHKKTQILKPINLFLKISSVNPLKS